MNKQNIMINRISATCLLASLLLFPTACIEEEVPIDVVSAKQAQHLEDSQRSLLYGISSFMVSVDTWGGSDYYTNDWGFPCQMYFRELNGEDFPVYQSTFDYWTYHENGTYASSYTIYTWYYYYCLIRNCNNLIGSIDEATASDDCRTYLGSALAFRAMAYLDLARTFEFLPTGFKNLDQKAEEAGVWGLTVPIVTETTTEAQGVDNPRAERDTMYAFILNDLERAERLLDGYNPADCSLPGHNAVKGLQARAYMEVGRYEEALAAAQSAMVGYSPVSEEQWHDAKTGFNTANQAWIWRCRIGGKEQQPTYYCSFPGQIASEPLSGLPYAYNAFRCIGSYLYGKISSNDWRKTTWLDPKDAVLSTKAIRNRYQTSLDSTQFIKIPAYANLKFRPYEGNVKDHQVWLNGDIPVMRVEEMYFIAAEATARTQGYAAGLEVLRQFVQNYRYKSGTNYSPKVTDFDSFLTEMMVQKRIEFWGEGICFFDYKRLRLQVRRDLSTNVESAFQLVSKAGYCAPWMNYYIPKTEIQRNGACIANPDVSGDYL